MNDRKPLSLHTLREMHRTGEKIAVLTAYDATFARAVDEAGVDCTLVGDSLGMVLQGHSTTVPVTVDEMAYHVRCVARGNRNAWIIGDLPYGSYHESVEQAYRSACALMQAGAHMVKLEGGGWAAQAIEFIVKRGIPVCAHLGLTPQSVHALGGYRIQGKDAAGTEQLKREAHEIEQAGAAMVVLELMPAAVGTELTKALSIPTIGIGAGPDTSGQVLVLHDMLGLSHGKVPRFVKKFMQSHDSIQAALQAYVQEVKSGKFPDPAIHAY